MNTNARQLVTKTMIALLLGWAVSTDAAIRYVAPDGSGTNGQSWATAYRNLQTAIDDAEVADGDEIHVKEGRYVLDRAVKVNKAVKILGGYSGASAERDAQLFVTTLDAIERTFHGFVVTSNAQIDGFTITGGNASYNSDIDGGGMLITNCSASVTNCVFVKNASYRWGGAVALSGADGTVVTDCTFTGNVAGARGGAIHTYDSDCVISRCVFTRNEATADTEGWGGGIMNDQGAPSITGCTFTENSAFRGAAICNWQSRAIVESCTFADCNALTACGGGVYNAGGSPTISKCLFRDNDVTNWGGAIFDEFSDATVTDCILWKNSAMVHGGAVYLGGNSDLAAMYPTFVNCTLYGNKASRGGALYSYGCAATLWNCILWGNEAFGGDDGIYNNTLAFSAATSAFFCDIQGDEVYPGEGNLCADPLFQDPATGDFQMQSGSPCIDAGSGTPSIETLDYEGNRRVVDGDEDGSSIVDLGALEFQIPTEVSHPYRGEILQTVAYDSPDDTSATYVFSMMLETDDTVDRIEFRTPNSDNTCVIPNDSQTSSKDVTTSHALRDGKYVWQYRAEMDSPAALEGYGNGTYRITLYYQGDSQYEIQVPYAMATYDKAIASPTQRPRILSPVSRGSMGSPVTATWDMCTDTIANTICLTITDSATGQEVAADAFDTGAIASDAYSVPEGSYDLSCAFANLQEGTGSDGTPFTCGKAITVSQPLEVPYSAVYRFWSPVYAEHFYTTHESDKDWLIRNYPHVWTFEGHVYNACSTPCYNGLLPVYRFVSGDLHFYTIDQKERDRLIAESAAVWTPEGIAFYAYPEGSQPAGCVPVYQFRNATNDAHFYTTSEEERTTVITEFEHVFVDEGIAYYAYP
ncbi:MAG: choice-of-anchor Q domain-containing protein [Phycisphaerales bacterium]